MKKRVITIIMVTIFALIGCGGGESSKEAKELLQRILTLVGIPQDIVINICQDNNANNLCENSEILTKLTINKGDSLEDIWHKIEFDDSNSYWIDQIDPNKKLLLVMEDTDSVRYDDGKFALPFNINPNREVNATKELSILEAMVDASYLNSSEVIEVKKMNFVEKFYDALLKDLMKNFNTLKDKSLDSATSILANIKFMADVLRDKGIGKELPDSVNACGNNDVCVDEIIAGVFKDLEITDSEAEAIAEREGGSKEAHNENSSSKKTIDFADYLPNSNMERAYTEYLDGDSFKGGATIFEHKDKVTKDGNTLTYVLSHNYRGYENSWETDEEKSQIIIKEDTIEYPYFVIGDIKPYYSFGESKRFRHLKIGDTSFTNHWESEKLGWGKGECRITKKLTTFSHRDHSYSGDIIEEKCINKAKSSYSGYEAVPESYNVSYNYYKKGIGFIATIDDDCIVETEVQDNGKVTVGTAIDIDGCTVNNMKYIYYKN